MRFRGVHAIDGMEAPAARRPAGSSFKMMIAAIGGYVARGEPMPNPARRGVFFRADLQACGSTGRTNVTLRVIEALGTRSSRPR